MTELSQARAAAQASRQRLIATAHEVQVRISPAVLANNAVEEAKRRGEEMADGAVAAVRRRPIAASAAAAGVTALLGYKLFSRLRRKSDKHGDKE